MRKLVITLAILVFISCKKEETKSEPLYPISVENEVAAVQKPEQLGEEIFKGKGNCITCHLVDQKVIGPSLQDIAKIYKDQNGDIVNFLKGEGKPLVDPSQYEIMKTNFVVTKAMSDAELKGLEAYIYSNSK